ncbi:MAG: hypothetical protein J0L91_12315, partial [Burkholderiales bacterium]|nr:hypothetical protein [Burkholderiales bacterium]
MIVNARSVFTVAVGPQFEDRLQQRHRLRDDRPGHRVARHRRHRALAEAKSVGREERQADQARRRWRSPRLRRGPDATDDRRGGFEQSGDT